MFLTMEKPARIVPGVGPPDAKIAIVGEAPGAYEDQQLKPFVGPAGSVLEQCLSVAGLIRSEVYLTNVVKVRPNARNDISPFWNSAKGTFSADGVYWVDQLREELNNHSASVIVACGGCAFSALTGFSKITRYRGYIFPSIGLNGVRKVLPMIHPSASLQGQYIYRHLIAADLKKARLLAKEPPGIQRPQRQLIYEWDTLQEVLEWLDYYEHQSILCIDIEVLNYEISCIGLSSDPSIAVSIPLVGQWTELEMCELWRSLQRVLGNQGSIKVLQNGIFDIHFLLTRCGLSVRGPIRDTMIGHSVMFPELRKGLDFLGSIYCGQQEYWKDMVRFDNIKEES